MGFNLPALRKKLKEKRKNLRRAIKVSKENGYAFHSETQILRTSNIELINEILRIIDELET